MSAELSEKRGSGLGWLEYAVFKLDGWLRRRQGIFEYSTNAQCLFRVELGQADQSVTLSDATRIRCGDPILVLHLWNEHIPAMGQGGPTVAWARQVSRAIHTSLRELARYLPQQPRLDEVIALCGDMHLGSPKQTRQLAHIVAHYGFEAVEDCNAGRRRGALHRLGKSILIVLLVAATNPVALRSTILRRYHRRVYLSRATLERRYRN